MAKVRANMALGALKMADGKGRRNLRQADEASGFSLPCLKRAHASGLSFLLCLLGLGGLVIISIPAACSFGPLDLGVINTSRILLAYFTGTSPVHSLVLYAHDGLEQLVNEQTLTLLVADLRLPRVLLSLAAGAGLALAGTVFQGILRNPLADPFTLGVSGGAAFGAALAISFGFTGTFMGFGLPLAAFAGASVALGAVLLLGRIGGGLRRETLVLAGVVVSAFLAALIALVKALDEASVTGIVFWIMGSFQGRGWTEAGLLAPGLGVGCLISFLLWRELDILSLGDHAARHLGLSAARMRLILLLAAGWMTASCVTVSGIIGFVGLIVPHLCRLLVGAGHRRLLPAAALLGGLLLLWSDTVARTVMPGGVELPVGVITALFGGPFFCLILGNRLGRFSRGPVMLERAPEKPETASAVKTAFYGHALPQSAVSGQFQGHNVIGTRAVGAAQEKGCGGAGTKYRRALVRRRQKALLPLRPGAAHHPAPAPDAPAAVNVLCEDLCFAYGHVRQRQHAHILSHICLSLRQGEFVGLLGPNGSGKSTLLHCICGMLSPQTGQSQLMGQDISRLSERRRALLAAVLPQRPQVVPALSVFSLILMGRYARTRFLGGYGKEDALAAWRALEEAGAAHLADRTADTLSGGELQRVLLARALAQDTAVLLLDEVAAGLDPACQTAVFDALARRNRMSGLSILAALHDLNLAALYCKRLIFIKEGRIVADGPTEELFTPDMLRVVYESEISLVRHPAADKPQALLMPGR